MKSKFIVMAIALGMSCAGLACAAPAFLEAFNVQWGLEGLQDLNNVHPLFVHFPIALLLSATALYILGFVSKRESFYVGGKWSLYLGTLGAALAVLTGLQAAKTVPHGGQTHSIMMVHQYLGIVVLVLSLVLSLWLIVSKANIPASGRVFFLIGLFALSAILTQQADFGGRMVFTHGVGVGKKSMMMQESGTHDHQEHAGEHEHGHEGHAH